ncbi:MAG: hypothetical protein H0X26_00610 [Alphaproteobacteria bacterium]|nr:hypothetical protein [Alphaproteobacteria bacterium]
MKKLIGFMGILFVFTLQNAFGLYTQCIDSQEDCRQNICSEHRGMKLQFPPYGNKRQAQELGLEQEYNECQKFLCVCNGD